MHINMLSEKEKKRKKSLKVIILFSNQMFEEIFGNMNFMTYTSYGIKNKRC